MKYDPEKHHRHSIRLKEYDYTQVGAYFVTICTWGRECLFGEIVDGEMRLNECGHIVTNEWARSCEIRQEIELDEWIIMPNHVHGIVIITNVGAHGRAPLQHDNTVLHRKPRSLSSFIAGFKSSATKRINETRGLPGVPVWQRNYYEHVIRNEESLNEIRQYIAENPMRWAEDEENPENIGTKR
jgi:Transposase and inactivated derivatives